MPPEELVFVSVDGTKVGLVGTDASDLLGQTRTQYQKIDMRGLNTSGITNMSYLFSGCENLTELEISELDTSGAESMAHMFDGCQKLKAVDLSNFDTSNVTDMSYMFANCTEITEMDVSNFATSNVTDMGHMFANCRYLKKLTVGPGWDRSNANVWYMYYDTKLETYP